jgi:hypothetical protein
MARTTSQQPPLTRSSSTGPWTTTAARAHTRPPNAGRASTTRARGHTIAASLRFLLSRVDFAHERVDLLLRKLLEAFLDDRVLIISQLREAGGRSPLKLLQWVAKGVDMRAVSARADD